MEFFQLCIHIQVRLDKQNYIHPHSINLSHHNSMSVFTFLQLFHLHIFQNKLFFGHLQYSNSIQESIYNHLCIHLYCLNPHHRIPLQRLYLKLHLHKIQCKLIFFLMNKYRAFPVCKWMNIHLLKSYFHHRTLNHYFSQHFHRSRIKCMVLGLKQITEKLQILLVFQFCFS